MLELSGEDACARAEHVTRHIGEAEFLIAGHIVADALVEARVQDNSGPAMLVRLLIGVLTIEDW